MEAQTAFLIKSSAPWQALDVDVLTNDSLDPRDLTA